MKEKQKTKIISNQTIFNTIEEFNYYFFNSKNKKNIYDCIKNNKFNYDDSHFIYSIIINDVNSINYFIVNKYKITEEIKYNFIKHIDFVKNKDLFAKFFKTYDNDDLLCACINQKYNLILNILEKTKFKPSGDCMLHLLTNYKNSHDIALCNQCIELFVEKKYLCNKNDMYHALKHNIEFLIDYLNSNLQYTYRFYKNILLEHSQYYYNVDLENFLQNVNLDEKYMILGCKIMNYKLIKIILDRREIKPNEKYFKIFLNNFHYEFGRSKHDPNYYYTHNSENENEIENEYEYESESESEFESSIDSNMLNKDNKQKSKDNNDSEYDSEDYDSEYDSEDYEDNESEKNIKYNSHNLKILDDFISLFIFYDYVPSNDDITELSQCLYFFDKKYHFLENYIPNKRFYENVILYRTLNKNHTFKCEYNQNMYKDELWLEALCDRDNKSKKMQEEIKNLMKDYNLKPTTKCKLEASRNCTLLNLLYNKQDNK
jgi:hypothetical protein